MNRDEEARWSVILLSALLAMGPLPMASGMADGATESLEDRIARLERAQQQAAADNGSSNGNLRARYDGGFILEQVDPSNSGNSFLLKQNTRFQFRYSHFSSDGANPDENNFEIERIRPKFTGHTFWPHFTYELQLDIDNDDADRVELYNAFLRYDFSAPKGWTHEVALKMGLWKMPLFRQEYTSDGRQMMVDRSMANEFFNIDHSVGIGLEGEVTTGSLPFWWHLVVLNGFDTDHRTPGRTGQLDRNFAYVVRWYSDLMGEWGKDEESDLSFHESAAIRAGLSAGYSDVQVTGGLDSSGNPTTGEQRVFRTTDGGTQLITLAPTLTDFTVWLYGADLGFKYRGLSVVSELYVREIVDAVGAVVPDLFDYGYYVQAGYFVVPGKVELTSRYSQIVGDSGSLGGDKASADEWGGGFNYYIKKHNLKIQCDVLSYNGSPVGSSSAQLIPGDTGILGRIQAQWAY